jgi:hypothetical protein
MTGERHFLASLIGQAHLIKMTRQFNEKCALPPHNLVQDKSTLTCGVAAPSQAACFNSTLRGELRIAMANMT